MFSALTKGLRGTYVPKTRNYSIELELIKYNSDYIYYFIVYEIIIGILLFLYWMRHVYADVKKETEKFVHLQAQGNKSSSSEFKFKKIISKFIRTIIAILKYIGNFLSITLKPRIAIRLNLNYRNLTERNILQLIATSLFEEYKKWRRSPFQRIVQLVKFILSYTIISILYQPLKQRLEICSILQEIRKLDIYNKINCLYKYIWQLNETIYRDSFLPSIIDYVQLDKIFKYIFPPTFDPFLPLVFLICWLIIRWLCIKQWIYIPGHLRILRLLKDLIERMTAAETKKVGIEIAIPKGLSKVFYNKNLAYPLADERTIEQTIISILDEISRRPSFLGHPIFIFVFDELDKISPSDEVLKKNKESISSTSSFEGLRRRQQQVEEILSNLKQLITTAHAKFIFVAGREMYDASLADFTSRSYIHSSIFNQIFYVDSFLTDHSDPNEDDLTAIIESYVCQFLLAMRSSEKSTFWPKLKNYQTYINNRFDINQNESNNHNKNTEIVKVLQVLHDFIIYLTYRGCGSPKKIIQLFESFIHPLPSVIKPEEWLIIGENHKSLYLVFNFPQQYVISSTARLLQPIYHPIERTARYNDKLTTSIFMVLDYLFKFHRSAFSIYFLERMPEMLNVHRDPDLRNLIHEILALIENNYLERVQNGLFDYRFTNRIHGEIDYVSRIDERESAAFNFTLDESLEAEQFFRRQLKDLEKSQTDNEAGKLLAIKHYHEIIGDFHAFDEEHDQAIAEYNCALYPNTMLAQQGDLDRLKVFNSKKLLNLRLWLKIGLAYEKAGNYVQAAVSYQEAISISEPFFEKHDLIYIISINEFQILFQAIFSKAYLHEKDPTKAHADFQQIEDFLRKFEKIVKYSINSGFQWEKMSNLSLFYATCLNHAANLFYYKGLVPPDYKRNSDCATRFPENKLFFLDKTLEWYHKSIKILCSTYLSYGDIPKQNKNNPKELILFIIKMLDTQSTTGGSAKTSANVTIYKLLGIALSHYGNVKLCTVEPTDPKFNILSFKNFLKCWNRRFEQNETISPQEDSLLDEIKDFIDEPFIEIIAYYLTAIRFFLRAAMHKESAFEYEKIILLLRYVNFNLENYMLEFDDFHDILKNFIFDLGNKYYQLTYQNITTEEIDNGTTNNSVNTLPSPVVPEILGFILEWIRLEDKLLKPIPDSDIQLNRPDIYKKIFDLIEKIDEFDNFDNVMNRIDRLNFKERKRKDRFWEKIGIDKIEDEEEGIKKFINNNSERRLELLDFINDGLFCCLSSINLREIHSNTYWWLHRGRAFMHLFLANWTRRYNLLLNTIKDNDEESKIRKKVISLVGHKQIKYIDEQYQLQQALENFHQVKQTHTGGKAYKSLIQRMYFLNDDFNDRGYHFYLALERYELRRDKVDKQIKKVEKRLEEFNDKKS